jgi:hypothetical protein
MKEQISTIINEAASRRSLSPLELAYQSGVKFSAVEAIYESGNYSIDDLLKVAEHLNIKINAYFEDVL